MKKHILSIGILFLVIAAHAQVNEARWWYFGSGGGIDFNPNPIADPNGTLFTYEGCSSISGPVNGNLEFYTDGLSVKTSTHVNMPNGTGLMGNGSSTQSGQVVPYPGSSTKYYIFTMASNVGANGLRYSVVDMTLNGGLGDVVAAQKNVFLGNSYAEKIAAVKNGNNYWVTTLRLPGQQLHAYEVDATGVNNTAVVSNTGIILANNNFYGCMKSNPQGTQLAAVHQGINNQVHVFDFNKATGMVTGTTTITVTPPGGAGSNTPYGVEFSPNGNLLYTQSWNVSDLKQYDLTAGNAAAISASEVILGSNANTGGGSLQTGPDEKLYGARFGQTYICEVTNPNTPGAGAGYVAQAVNLSPGDISRWGLPLFLGSFFGATIEVVDNCFGLETQFVADTTNVDSMFWDFGDTLSGALNYAQGLDTVSHLYTDTGTFEVQLVIYNGINTDTIVEEVYIYPRQWADLGNDTALCVGLEFTIDQDQPYASWEWHDGSTDSVYTVKHPDDVVMVTVSGVCDTVADTLNVDFFYPFDLDIGNDTSMCTYDQINLNTGLVSNSTTIFNHQWSTGATQNNIVTTGPGTYMVTVDDGLCTYSDTIEIDNYSEVDVELGNDSSFCYENQVTLSPKSTLNVVNYKWSSGIDTSTISTNASIDVFQTDMYYVTVAGSGNHCYDYDSVEWSLWFEPLVDLGNDTSFCHNDILTLEPKTTSAFPMSYLWNDNSGNPSLNVTLVGLYWVEVSDENCSIKDTIIVDQYPKLDVTLGEDVNTCDGKTVTLSPKTSIPVTSYVWSDGSDLSTLKIGGHGTYAVTVDNGLCSNADQINVFYHTYPNTDLGPDTAICPKDQLVFDVTEPGEVVEYKWSTGSENPVETINPTEKTTYWVRATNVVCTTVDSIAVSIREVPNTYLGRDTAICADGELPLAVEKNETIESYAWSTGEDSPRIVVTDTGEYVVSVYDGHCTTPGKINVTYKNSPNREDVSLQDYPNVICIGEKINLNVLDSRFTAYEWQDGSTAPNYTVTEEGQYSIRATHACGVLADTIVIERCECPIWAPTAFNPDGNDLNDRFNVRSDCKFIEYKFSVYNRWGELVFYSEDPNESWDGKFRNEKCPEGSFSWVVSYIANHEGELIEERETGTVLMLR